MDQDLPVVLEDAVHRFELLSGPRDLLFLGSDDAGFERPDAGRVLIGDQDVTT
jgi:hypothetical protein